MSHKYLHQLCDIATDAHTRFHQEIDAINVVVGVSQNMRDAGVPADVITIDCLQNKKRIILILHDQQPELISYQFSRLDSDPEDDFNHVSFGELTAELILDWMKSYLAAE